jgi:hypothetical protein
MPAPRRHRHLRQRRFDRLRQKLWAVPAWLWLYIRHRGASPKSRYRSSQIR